MKKFILALVLALSSMNAFADYTFVTVNDASTLKWQIAGGVVYFRNLNDYDPSVLSCCYNYSLSLQTPQGRAVWASLLYTIAAGKPVTLYLDRLAPSAVDFISN